MWLGRKAGGNRRFKIQDRKILHGGPYRGWKSFEPGHRARISLNRGGATPSLRQAGRMKRWFGMGEGSLGPRSHDPLTEVPK